MVSTKILRFAAVAALASFNASAESLMVGSGETVMPECKAYDAITVLGTLVVPSGGAVTCTATRVSIDGGTIQLNAGSVLRVKGIDVGASDSMIEFNGGKIVLVEELKTNGAGNLDLNGSGGDVVIDHVPTEWMRVFENATGVTGRIYVKGDNNLVINLYRASGFARNDWGVSGSVLLQHSGLTKINNPNDTAVYSSGNHSGDVFTNAEVVLGHNVNLDMVNIWHFMKKSLTGAGSVSGSYLRFEIPQNGEEQCFAQVDRVKELVKRGGGKLDVFTGAPTNLVIEAGEVCVLPRLQVGYSEFRLKIDGAGTPTRSGVKINSLALFSGADDVTAQYASVAISGQRSEYVDRFLDGTVTDSWWYGYDAHGGKSNPSFDEAYVDVHFNDRHVVTGYKLRTADTSGGDRPRAWRLFGRDSGGEWELLDQRVNEALPVDDYMWSGMFAATIPDDADATTRCKTLTMSSGAKLTVLSNATFVCDSFAPKGGEMFDFKPGSSVDFSSEDANGVATNVDFVVGTNFSLNGAFTKSGSGTLTLTGNSSSGGLEKIHDKEGILSFRSYNPWKHWKFVFCAIDNNLGTPTGMAVNEIAVYDANGNRLNLTGSATMGDLTETSFSEAANSRMYDGSDSTYWLKSSIPNPTEENTWEYTSFSLAPDSPAVAGYNLKSGGNGGGNSRPKTWKVYARENTTDDWTLIDSQTDVATPSAGAAWYNNGKSWAVTAAQGAGAAAFRASVPVTVDPGATLDLTHANATTMSHLVVDGNAGGYGTICGGTYAAEGLFEISVANSSPTYPLELPLLIDGAAHAGIFRNWKVVVNGTEKRWYRVLVSNAGHLTVLPPGIVVSFR